MARHDTGGRIPERVDAPAPMARAERIVVGTKLPGESPRSVPPVDAWTEVIDSLEYTTEGAWTQVAKVATEAAANLVVDRLSQHKDILSAIRVFGPGDLRVFALRTRMT